ncbi:hypothetical protein CHCC20375_2912 [Bacillus licheniformis]|nr:hypothetical protein CHCC20375_2912 [Bacillus licheniformis]
MMVVFLFFGDDTAEYVGLDGIGPYTMRKTFGYWNYKKLY